MNTQLEQSMNSKIQKAKTQLPFRGAESKSGGWHTALSTGWAEYLSHCSSLSHPSAPTPRHLRDQLTPPGGVSKGTCCLFSLRLQSEEPLPEFLT